MPIVEVYVDKLKELRINHGMSRRELAIRAGLAPSAVWNIETRGTAQPSSLKKLADVLGVRATDLLAEEEK